MKRVDERAKLVHGVAWAGFMAAAALLGVTAPAVANISMCGLREERVAAIRSGEATRPEYRTFLHTHCVAAVATTAAEINVNKIWEHIISGVERGVFGHSRAELQRFFKVKLVECAHPPLVPDHAEEERHHCPHCIAGGWVKVILHMEPQGVIDTLRKDLRTQGEALPLNKGDIGAQLSTRAYSLTKPGSRQRFGVGAGTSPCWVFDFCFWKLSSISKVMASACAIATK